MACVLFSKFFWGLRGSGDHGGDFSFFSSSTTTMTGSNDLRWRAVILYEFEDFPIENVASLLDVSVSSIFRWTRKCCCSFYEKKKRT
jgi:hypothetical protein